MKRSILGIFFLAAACSSSARTAPDGGMMMSQPHPDLSTMIDPMSPFDPASACVTATQMAAVAYQPVDIIWLIDNSSSMQPAIDAVAQGLNQFATLIDGKNLDYKIIMLSLKSEKNPVSTGGSNRWGVCIPPPLSGDAHCGNGARFFHSSMDIKSTQPLEQLLGTLGQTTGFQPGDERGGDPWKDQLRDGATKTIVVVSDDDSRLTPDQFENGKAGKDPYNPNVQLPPGILDSSWNGLFDHYIFDGIYGWGSDTDVTKTCTYSDGTVPPKPGQTYSELVTRTSGVREKICGTAASWSTFLDTVAQAVSTTAQLTCALPIPAPPAPAQLDPAAINVSIDDDNGASFVYKVAGASACGSSGGWYYDDDANPTQVILCPASCDLAQGKLAASHAKIDVYFGCKSIVG
jgi:hypothetical protein